MFGLSFSIKIKDIRLKYKLNQEEFANRINNYSSLKDSPTNFNKTNVSKWENGKVEPRMDTVRLIASTFEVSPNYLICMSDVPKWANNDDVIIFDQALKRNSVVMSYDGVELSEEEKLQLDGMIRAMLWERIKKGKE